jgi:RES domain
MSAGSGFCRIHQTSRDPIFFGKSKEYRFDDPKAEFGVLYAGTDEECAFLETLVRVPKSKGRVLRSDLRIRSMSTLETVKPLRLVDLRDHHLAQLRLDSRIFSQVDYTVPQQWARAFYEHSDPVDGLIFNSRHNPKLHVVALFDRAGHDCAKIVKTQSLDSKEFEPTLGIIVDRYRFKLL